MNEKQILVERDSTYGEMNISSSPTFYKLQHIEKFWIKFEISKI